MTVINVTLLIAVERSSGASIHSLRSLAQQYVNAAYMNDAKEAARLEELITHLLAVEAVRCDVLPRAC